MTAPGGSHIFDGYEADPGASMSLHADAYTDVVWFEREQRAVFAATWHWIGHIEKLRDPGSYLTADVAGMPIVAVRDKSGVLHAFYNVCRHRAHHLLAGEGTASATGLSEHALHHFHGLVLGAYRCDLAAHPDRSDTPMSVDVGSVGGVR